MVLMVMEEVQWLLVDLKSAGDTEERLGGETPKEYCLYSADDGGHGEVR